MADGGFLNVELTLSELEYIVAALKKHEKYGLSLLRKELLSIIEDEKKARAEA